MFINKKNSSRGLQEKKTKQKPYVVIAPACNCTRTRKTILKIVSEMKEKKNGNATDDKQQLAIDATSMITIIFCLYSNTKLIVK